MSFQTTPDDSVIKRTETVGKVQPHVRAKLIDADGNIVPIGTPGEICVSGYLVQKGCVVMHFFHVSEVIYANVSYWGDEEQTSSVMRRHADDPETLWMHTGDVGVMDEEGYLKGESSSFRKSVILTMAGSQSSVGLRYDIKPNICYLVS